MRIERVSGPLANPDALVHLISPTLAQLFKILGVPWRNPPTLSSARGARLPACECGNNPYLAYYIAGEQALTEAVVLLQADLPPTRRKESDVAETIYALRQLAREDIEAFCGLCNHRGCAVKCRHALVAC